MINSINGLQNSFVVIASIFSFIAGYKWGTTEGVLALFFGSIFWILSLNISKPIFILLGFIN